MTPDERADQFASVIHAMIEETVSVYVAEERAACAEVARRHADGVSWDENAKNIALRIAELIEARSKYSPTEPLRVNSIRSELL